MWKLFTFIACISTALASYRELTFQHVTDDAKVTNSPILSTTHVHRLTSCFWDCINTPGCISTNILHHLNNNTFTCSLIPQIWLKYKLEYAPGYMFYSSLKKNFQLQLTHGTGFCISHEDSKLRLDFCSSKYTYFQMDAFKRLMVNDLCVHASNVHSISENFVLTEDCTSGWMFDFVGTKNKSYIKVITNESLCVHVSKAHYDKRYAALVTHNICASLAQTEFRRIER